LAQHPEEILYLLPENPTYSKLSQENKKR